MRHLLIVDDDRAAADAIRRALELRLGPAWPSTTHAGLILAIDIASDTEAALRMLRDRPRDAPYEVLIADVSMLTFDELAFLIHVGHYRFPELRTLLIGAQGDDELATLAPQVCAHAALGKPFAVERIVQAVRPWLVPDRGPASLRRKT